MVSTTSQLFLLVYLHAHVEPSSHPATALLPVLSAGLLCFAHPASLDECFFDSLIIGLSCSLVFWKLWLFFVFKFVVFLLVV